MERVGGDGRQKGCRRKRRPGQLGTLGWAGQEPVLVLQATLPSCQFDLGDVTLTDTIGVLVF